MQGLDGVNGGAPNVEFWWGEPCKKPVTFHHLLPRQIQGIYAASKYSDLTTPDYSDIFHHTIPKSAEWMISVDFPGNDFELYGSETPELCQNKCRETDRCVVWIHDKEKRCFLKDKIGQIKKDVPGSTAGFIKEHYKCRN